MAFKIKKQQSTEDKLDIVLRRLPEAKEVCLDLETSGLDFKRNHIVGWVYTFGPAPQDSYYLPFRHAAGGNIGGHGGPQTKDGWTNRGWKGLHHAERELIKSTDRPGLTVIGHNLSFDLRFAWAAGMQKLAARFEDTVINAPLLNELQPKFSLDFCCKVAGVAAKKVDIIRDHIRGMFPDAGERDYMGHYWRLAGDDPIAVEYAEGDGTSTWQLRDKQMPEIQRQNLTLVHDIESRLLPVLARMSCVGIKIDVERLEWLLAEINGRLDKLYAAFPKDFNAKSPIDVEKWCTDHGQTDWLFTSHPTKPKPSFKEDWLETHEPGRKIVAVRKLTTLRDTFVVPMRDVHLFNGRVHTNYNQLRGDEFGTVTGRLSCNDPNLQAAPKHNIMIGRLYRSIFVPDDGMIWGNADYSQIEPRLLAYYSRCRMLLDGYNATPPIDAHTTASIAANRNWPTMNADERKAYRNNIGKRINQTIVTGGGKNVLVNKYKVPSDQVDELWNNFFRMMPEIRTLQKLAANTFRSRGYVVSLLGRRARLQRPDLDYTATNRLLQCGNADIIKLKMVEVDEYLGSIGRPVDMLNNIHDDLAFQFPEEHRPVYENCLSMMTRFKSDDVICLDVPITVDAGEGKNWAIASYGEEKEAKPVATKKVAKRASR